MILQLVDTCCYESQAGKPKIACKNSNQPIVGREGISEAVYRRVARGRKNSGWKVNKPKDRTLKAAITTGEEEEGFR